MFYRTLHWYIFREMLRIFLMTSSALTTLMAFGGMFKPVTKYGIDLSQLMIIMTNLMPAMLAYSIPVSALFAAVLVYWRMSTDNEVTACRAGGISFSTLVMPAFALGLIVASVDMVFVHFVVPKYLQATERAVMRDLGSLIASTIGKQESFRYGQLIVYADSATAEPGENPYESIVYLKGVAATPLGKENLPSAIVVAEQAKLIITEMPTRDETKIAISLTDAAAFDPVNFRRLVGSFTSLAPGGKELTIPSQLKTKPKFLNFRQLKELENAPYKFPQVKEIVDRIEQTVLFQEVTQHLSDNWKKDPRVPLVFDYRGHGDSASRDQIKIYAPVANLDVNLTLTFQGAANAPIRIETYRNSRLTTTYTASEAHLVLAMDDYTVGAMNGTLMLGGNVTLQNHVRNIAPIPIAPAPLAGIMIPTTLYTSAPMDRLDLLNTARASSTPVLQQLTADVSKKMGKLFQTIHSETHSRMSFAVSCLTLVLLGAALGILLKGQNPLAVFVLGFVPAIFLMLLITAGRQLAEGAPRTVPMGIATIWAGNGLLLLMVTLVYAKLFRQ